MNRVTELNLGLLCRGRLTLEGRAGARSASPGTPAGPRAAGGDTAAPGLEVVVTSLIALAWVTMRPRRASRRAAARPSVIDLARAGLGLGRVLLLRGHPPLAARRLRTLSTTAMTIRVPTNMSTKTPATTSSLVFSTFVGVLGGTISWVVRVAFGGVGMAVSCCNWVSRCSVYRVTIGSCWLTSAGTLPVTVIWINGPAANCGTTAV